MNFAKKRVKELKSDNPRAIKRGNRQVKEYRKILQRKFDGKWRAFVETYASPKPKKPT